ncbi:MAG TPA: fimbria/pilus outer membrane usher protein [Allosphingosinicella sp.]|nr:fimbria/pilus outer membrane usher protein [Allosphingosinicella sp.]
MPTPNPRFAAIKRTLLGLLLATSSPALAIGEAARGATASPLEPTLLEVTVNGQEMGEPLLLQRDAGGGLYASEALLRQWRIRLPSAAPVTVDGEHWYRIDNDPGLRATLAAAEQTLAIDARAELFDRQSADLGAAAAFEMTPSGSGAFLNYDVLGEYSRGEIGFNAALEAGIFTRFGVGSTGMIVRAGGDGTRLLRLDTSWTIDRPESLTSIRIGDAVTIGGAGVAPVRFGGLQYARNFETRPGYLTMPLPMLAGSATVPSVVDVYVNNQLQGSRDVAPGPFEVTNVPVQSGVGTVQLVMRDLLGRQIVMEQSYYASSVLLRRGLHDFSYEIGFLRAGYGARSMDYGAPIASTSHRYGLSDRVTLEGHAQASRDVQAAGLGIGFALFDLGMIGGSATLSRSDRGAGMHVSGSVERRTTGLSFGIRAEYASENFNYVGAAEDERPSRLSVQAFADVPVFGGSIGVSLVHRSRRGDEEDESLAGIFANVPLIDNASIQLFARRAVAGNAQTVFGANVSFALGGRRSAAARVEYRDGGLSRNISYQDDAPSGIGGGYRASANYSDGRRTMESVYTFNAASASFTAHLSRAGGSSGVRLSARGSVGLVGGSPFAARALGASFAEVRVGDHAGVRVYADNQLIGITGADGSLVVPSLRAFDRNMIRIEEGDLPLDVQIAQTEVPVRPFARAGAVVRFAVRRERGVLLQVVLEDGSPLPAGALVSVAGSPEMHVAASGGEVYIPTLDGTALLEASWGDRRCGFQVTVPEGDDPQPRIAGLVCRTATSLASR